MINYMSVAEFRDFGFLQEVNRQFLHPLGLALAVGVDETGNVQLAGILDARDDPEGMVFAELTPSDVAKAERVAALQRLAAQRREVALGYYVQPLPGSKS